MLEGLLLRPGQPELLRKRERVLQDGKALPLAPLLVGLLRHLLNGAVGLLAVVGESVVSRGRPSATFLGDAVHVGKGVLLLVARGEH